MNEALMKVRVELGVNQLMERIHDEVCEARLAGKSWVLVPTKCAAGVVRDRMVHEVQQKVAGSDSVDGGRAIVIRW